MASRRAWHPGVSVVSRVPAEPTLPARHKEPISVSARGEEPVLSRTNSPRAPAVGSVHPQLYWDVFAV